MWYGVKKIRDWVGSLLARARSAVQPLVGPKYLKVFLNPSFAFAHRHSSGVFSIPRLQRFAQHVRNVFAAIDAARIHAASVAVARLLMQTTFRPCCWFVGALIHYAF